MGRTAARKAGRPEVDTGVRQEVMGRSWVALGTVSLEGGAGRVRGAQAMDEFSVSQET